VAVSYVNFEVKAVAVSMTANGHGLAMWRYLKNVQPGTAAE
jgi:hypothetical protein